MNTYKVRFAGVADIPALIDIECECHSETRYAVIPYDLVRRSRQYRLMLNPPKRRACVLLSEDHDKGVIGFMSGYISEHPCVDANIATGQTLYIRPEWRHSHAADALLHAFKIWAQRRRADVIRIRMESGFQLNRFDAFIKRLGCEREGENYSMWLNALGKVKR